MIKSGFSSMFSVRIAPDLDTSCLISWVENSLKGPETNSFFWASGRMNSNRIINLCRSAVESGLAGSAFSPLELFFLLVEKPGRSLGLMKGKWLVVFCSDLFFSDRFRWVLGPFIPQDPARPRWRRSFFSKSGKSSQSWSIPAARSNLAQANASSRASWCWNRIPSQSDNGFKPKRRRWGQVFLAMARVHVYSNSGMGRRCIRRVDNSTRRSKEALWATRHRPPIFSSISPHKLENSGSSHTCSGVIPWIRIFDGWKMNGLGRINQHDSSVTLPCSTVTKPSWQALSGLRLAVSKSILVNVAGNKALWFW